MDEIELDRLDAGHLARYQKMFATSDDGECLLVWDSNRLIPMVSADSEGTLIEHAAIPVRSFEAHDLMPVFEKITQLDPHGGRRLVREG